ncbi:hypothetical protein [Chthonobacter albigriseus]|uniref:hypothetical protein n=1 Tax=Chthonobacter albigriseus TaxID=1683161 RepID=UPI0015EEB8FD|nr:hypothetical protein [Chthonobacter albigriseus]
MSDPQQDPNGRGLAALGVALVVCIVVVLLYIYLTEVGPTDVLAPAGPGEPSTPVAPGGSG